MIKKIIPVFLCICLSFAVICYGENTVETPGNIPTPPQGVMPADGEFPQMEGMPPMGEMPPQGEVPAMGERPSRGEMPQGGVNPAEGSSMPTSPVSPETQQPTEQEAENNQNPDTITEATPTENMPQQEDGREQGRMPSFGQSQSVETESFLDKYLDAIVSVILLILAYVFVIFYKRRQY